MHKANTLHARFAKADGLLEVLSDSSLASSKHTPGFEFQVVQNPSFIGFKVVLLWFSIGFCFKADFLFWALLRYLLGNIISLEN